MNWFEVDREGLRKLIESRGKGPLVAELIQNGWDEEGVSLVDVTLEKKPGVPQAVLKVEDDSPKGWADLSHAWTLYADSKKKHNPKQRGRFNLGEKLVLAFCLDAQIITTTGSVTFDGSGRRKRKIPCTVFGSIFSSTLRMNNAEYEECCNYMKQLIPPSGITTTFNGVELLPREPLKVVKQSLPTVVAGEDGILRRTTLITEVEIYEPLEGETACIYEMGLPVVETGDKYHANVQQKVLLNTERDNVTPRYLQVIRTLVLNATHAELEEEEVSENWVRQAASHKDCSHAAIGSVLDKRYGKNRAAFDPSDTEAVSKLQGRGYTIIPSRGLTPGERANAKLAGEIKSAGQILPTPKVKFSPEGQPLKIVPEEKWSDGMRAVVAYTKLLATELLGCEISVVMANEFVLKFGAWWGKKELTFNYARLGRAWFDEPVGSIEHDRLIIHEFAHHKCSNHLSNDYHEACCKLGAQLKQFALKKD